MEILIIGCPIALMYAYNIHNNGLNGASGDEK